MTAAAAVPAAGASSAPYVGLVTRLLAFSLDALIVNAAALVVGAAVGLALSMVSLPDALRALLVAVGGVAYVLWSAGFFIVFWSTTGQTPGNRLLRIRVLASGGGRLKPRRALLRFVGLTLAALPLMLGYLMILFDDRRRGLHDVLARSVVVEAPR
jgi:uncharacterized RDD family membrane protein YckC